MASTSTITIPATAAPRIKHATAADIREVRCEPDGSVVIHASAEAAALLAGRRQFGNLERMQATLVNRIADAWYDAGCPKES